MKTNRHNTPPVKVQQEQIRKRKDEGNPSAILFQHGSEKHYQAYLLRCWAEPIAETVTWRFSLEIIPSGKRIGFAKLSDVLKFLDAQTECL